jgi:uncharacterized membrane protein YeiB
VVLPGILLMNVVGMALPDPAYWDPSGYGGQTGWNLGVFFINSFLTEGTMRGIFTMLFGAGVILFTARKEAEGAGKSMAPLSQSIQTTYFFRHGFLDVLSMMLLAIWTFQLIASPLWLRYFRFGPMEWLWRWLTYGKRPQFSRDL